MTLDRAYKVRAGEELNWNNLSDYLKSNLNDVEGDMTVAQFHGGHANLTYLLTFGQKEYILRRPPFGEIAPGAHDMKREYRVLSKLHNHFAPAPKAYLLCEDAGIIGATFVIIERRTGLVVRYEVPEVFKKFDNIENRLTDAMIKTQAKLHNVDVEAAQLTKLGRPDGYLERQLMGWKNRWDLVKIETNSFMEKTFKVLSRDIPKPQSISIVHNDIKFDNCQFQPNCPDEVSSIFDWDMTTLGDPLSDLGMTLSYWPEERLKRFKNLPISLKGDFPSKAYIIEKYEEYSGFNVDQIKWYESLAYWKGAVIAQQLYKRFVDGDSKDKRMANFALSSQALALVSSEIAENL